MRQLFETMREIAWALVVVLGVAALATAVLQPRIFAARLAGVFDALEREGFDVKIKTPVGEASFDRSKAEQLENSDETILALRDEVASLQEENLRLRGPDTGAVEPPPVVAEPDVTPPPPLPTEPDVDEQPVIVPPGPMVPETAQWVAIAGAETLLSSQREELIRLQSGGFPEAVILKSGKWYQSSVIFPDRATAEARLPEVAQVIGVNRGAYLRALDVMCPVRTPVEGEPDVFSCN